MTSGQTAPRYCPSCQSELYPVGRLKPQPILSLRGKLLMALAVASASAIFFTRMVMAMVSRQRFQEQSGTHVRVTFPGCIGLFWLIPALVPGLIFGKLAYRCPRFLKLTCPKCLWRERYTMGGGGLVVPKHVTPTRQYSPPSEPDFDRLVEQTDFGPPAPSADPDNTSTDEADAWAYAELVRGRSPEDVAADLIELGWDADTAEHVAEVARKKTRHRRP